jgi:thymidylate synthase
MNYAEFKGINSFLVGMSRILLENAQKRVTRGLICYELPYPVVVKITNPLARIATIQERKWNYVLPFAESLWIASGRNDLDLVSHYVKRMCDYSDDSTHMRAAYGPRMRYYNASKNDYKIGFRQTEKQENGAIDQFQFIVKAFKRDINTRQAIITITDPIKDLFAENLDLKETRDFPCTCSLQFIKVDNKLDLIVHMRSNDFVWGASAVNIFNYTFLQEYFSRILNIPIGNYYHVVNNLHYYEGFHDLLASMACADSYDDECFEYRKSFSSLSDFDQKVNQLAQYEHSIRNNMSTDLPDFEDDFFNDWARMFYHFNIDRTFDRFTNPILSNIIKSKNHERVTN